MWFSNMDSLKDLVFIRPSWLFDVFRSIFRHDFEEATFTPDDNLRYPHTNLSQPLSIILEHIEFSKKIVAHVLKELLHFIQFLLNLLIFHIGIFCINITRFKAFLYCVILILKKARIIFYHLVHKMKRAK